MPRTIRATDLFDLRSISAVSTSGERIVYAITWPDRETDENRSTLHLFEGDSGRALTDGHRDAAPTVSPDGERVAFLRSEPEGKAQAAICDIETGAVTIVPGYENEAVLQVDWVGNDRLLIRATKRPEELAGLDADEMKRRPLGDAPARLPVQRSGHHAPRAGRGRHRRDGHGLDHPDHANRNRPARRSRLT